MTPLVALALVAVGQAPDYPKVELKAPGISATVYLPDAKSGFYRGSRFAWAGVVKDLKFAGYTVFGPWKEKHDPAHNDDITGPAEEFGMHSPLGYADAKVGGRFVKIGVGELEKPKEEKYSFFTNYKIPNPGKWTVGPTTATSVRCQQEVDAANGFGYRYTKTIEVRASTTDGYAFLILQHELTNTGKKPIDTDVYNHNFFNVDGAPVGPDYWLVFLKPVKAAAGFKAERAAEFRDLRYMFGKVLEKEAPFGLLTDAKGEPQEHAFQMTYAPKGSRQGLRVQANSLLPVSKFQTWSIRGCMCPEPFSPIKLEPGKGMEWTITYTLNKGTVR